MRRVQFTYVVQCEIEISGAELSLLERCSRSHYDSLCRRTFELGSGNFGAGWLIRFLADDEHDEMARDVLQRHPERVVVVHATARDLDVCLKILEAAVGDQAQIQALRENLSRAFVDISVERQRLESEDPQR